MLLSVSFQSPTLGSYSKLYDEIIPLFLLQCDLARGPLISSFMERKLVANG